MACISGQEHFSGTIKHSSQLHSEDAFEQFKDKRVLVDGTGEAASDMVLGIVSVTGRCDVSTRNHEHRNLWGLLQTS